MSYASMSPMLSNRIRFPNYYRTVPEAVGLGTVLLTTMDYYGWKRLVVVSQEENVFSLVSFQEETNVLYNNMYSMLVFVCLYGNLSV